MSDPSRHDIWKMFDLISPTYDRINRILSFGMDRGWRKSMISHLPKRKDLSLLDLATGTGDQLIALLEQGVSIHSAKGIDLSSEMLLLAEEKMRSKPYGKKVSFLRADAQKIPFEKESFDATTISFGIRNMSDPVASLKEMYRVLKPDGRCLILEFSVPFRPIRPFYFFYLRHLLPLIGGFLSKKRAAYRYLNETIEQFPSGKAFCHLMERSGFEKIKTYPMALGSVTLYVGEKRK